MSPRVVVTGIGLWTPFAPDRESSWKAIVAGTSAVHWLSAPHWTESTLIAGAPLCPAQDPCDQRVEPLVELALATAREAINDAQLDQSWLDRLPVGVVFGTSKGGLHTFSQLMQEFREGSDASQSRSSRWLDVLPSRGATAIRELIGGYGPNLCPVAACATGLAACLRGAELIQNGDCDVVLAGSADASLQPALLNSFRRLGVLSREGKHPAQACRPFDRNRSGFVVGEGAACLFMERLDSALARGASIHAEWLGGAIFSDPFGLTQLDPAGKTLEHLLRYLRSRYSPRPDYINLHGTGTASNDRIECQAIRRVFADCTNGFTCSSLKGGLGHLLGAAGSVELAATVLALRDQIVPPTVNLLDPDPECDLSLTTRVGQSRPIEQAWKLSLGFGGHIAGACLARVRGVDGH